jgi:glycosyltransferase involved in cell wall biosynthesis
MGPLISVALPVLNGANYVADAVSSVLGQTYGAFELVIADNNSDDETGAVVERITKGDDRVKIVRSQSRLGQKDNVNRSVQLCAGTWVKVLCHDDFLEPNCLERLATVLNSVSRDVVLLGHGERLLFGNGYLHTFDSLSAEPPLRVYNGRLFMRSQLEGRTAAPLPALTTSLVRRDAWHDMGGFGTKSRHFDVFSWASLLLSGDYAYVSEPLTVNRIHSQQVAVSARRSLSSAFESQEFWRTYVSQHGDSLGLSRRAVLRSRMQGPSLAATAIAFEVLKHRPISALRVCARVPAAWLPLMPLLITRAIRRECQRTAYLREHVPREHVYL